MSEECRKHPGVKLNPYGVCSECAKKKEQELSKREEERRKRKEIWDKIIWLEE